MSYSAHNVQGDILFMRTIQDVGLEIIQNHPNKFYVFLGSEYGIKLKYIDILESYYGKKVLADSVSDVLSLMKTKHLIPLKPSVYVVRYDDTFLAQLSDISENDILSTNIVGTIVCIYDSSKASVRCDKYLPKFSVSIDDIDVKFKLKYLHSDFHSIPDRLLEFAAKHTTDYYQAFIVCNMIKHSDTSELYRYSDEELSQLFGLSKDSDINLIRLGVASRNFRYLTSKLDEISLDVDSIFYTVLSTCLDLEKLLDNPRIQSDISKFVKIWNISDVYNLFMQTYNQLLLVRSMTDDPKSRLIYVFSLLQFKMIPEVGELD